MNIAIVGTGYVGLVAGACFAESGNDVICIDNDQNKIESLQKGEIPIYEPGLEDLVKRNTRNGRLIFSGEIEQGVKSSQIIFIAVGTPPAVDGSPDLSYVLTVARGIAKNMNEPKIVVNKSTVPVGTGELVQKTISEITDCPFQVVSNPEFLKEGAAIDDFMKPDRVVIGTSDAETAEIMKELYAPFVRTHKPILIMDIVSAEMTKYAANTMLATRVSFMNEIANLCEKSGADVESVRKGIGSDSRIGMHFLFPGIGYGGSCFPKDVQGIIKTGDRFGVDLKIAKAVVKANDYQKIVLVDKIVRHYETKDLTGKTFAVWGLAFKAKTDDVRESPALTVCQHLSKMGASLQLFDPEAMDNFRAVFGDHPNVCYVQNNYQAIQGTDALVICTEWNEFRRPNFEKMVGLIKDKVIFDGRNIYSPEKMVERGFVYYGIGRTQNREFN